jgi:hypothetical protein
MNMLTSGNTEIYVKKMHFYRHFTPKKHREIKKYVWKTIRNGINNKKCVSWQCERIFNFTYFTIKINVNDLCAYMRVCMNGDVESGKE